MVYVGEPLLFSLPLVLFLLTPPISQYNIDRYFFLFHLYVLSFFFFKIFFYFFFRLGLETQSALKKGNDYPSIGPLKVKINIFVCESLLILIKVFFLNFFGYYFLLIFFFFVGSESEHCSTDFSGMKNPTILFLFPILLFNSPSFFLSPGALDISSLQRTTLLLRLKFVISIFLFFYYYFFFLFFTLLLT